MNEGWFWVPVASVLGRQEQRGCLGGRTLWLWDQFLGGGRCGRETVTAELAGSRIGGGNRVFGGV